MDQIEHTTRLAKQRQSLNIDNNVQSGTQQNPTNPTPINPATTITIFSFYLTGQFSAVATG